MPDLLYVQFKWTTEAREAWLNSSHVERMRQLNAGNNALDSAIPTMPIKLQYEKDSYTTIWLSGCDTKAAIYYNGDGELFAGWMNEMSNYMLWYTPPWQRMPLWQGTKNDLASFRLQSGLALVQRFQEMFLEPRPDALVLYRDLTAKAVEAHYEWAANGALQSFTVRK